MPKHSTSVSCASMAESTPNNKSSSNIPVIVNSSPASSVVFFDSIPSDHKMSSTLKSPNNNPRSCILQVGVSTGRLCGVAATSTSTSAMDNHEEQQDWIQAMVQVLFDVYRTSVSLQLPLHVAIRHKMELNQRKYPVQHCKGKAGKYTEYSHLTGVTKDNQVTNIVHNNNNNNNNNDPNNNNDTSWSYFCQQVPPLIQDIREFGEAREWTIHHTPRNIVLAMLGEVGELAELVQWKGDSSSSSLNLYLKFSELELDKLSQELADVSIYLLRLCSVLQNTEAFLEQLQIMTP